MRGTSWHAFPLSHYLSSSSKEKQEIKNVSLKTRFCFTHIHVDPECTSPAKKKKKKKKRCCQQCPNHHLQEQLTFVSCYISGTVLTASCMLTHFVFIKTLRDGFGKYNSSTAREMKDPRVQGTWHIFQNLLRSWQS